MKGNQTINHHSYLIGLIFILLVASCQRSQFATTARHNHKGKVSYSNSFQTELNFQPLERLDIRIAYRYLDVKQKLDGAWLERPLTAQHRALATISYAMERNHPDDPQTSLDVTLQWFGKKRIPETLLNPDSLRALAYSPSFLTMNLQVTRTFMKGIDVYLGIENLFNFRQTNPILDSANPQGPFFDASLIWGPLTGRMIYAGLRLGV